MDIADISKIGSRKRMNADAEKLREKLSRETSKIIKLKVAQDTAYWDLKEKLHQVENNHEKLQQNMVEVQMQHEGISGQYHEELRLRPETLNKLSSTREICEVLEAYGERLRESVSRCSTDQAALCEAFNHSSAAVRDLRQEHARNDEKNVQTINSLQEKLKLTSEHQSQLLQYFNATKQQADAELSELKSRFNQATAQKDELVTLVNELNRRLDVNKMELEKKEESILGLQGDIKQLVHEFTMQSNEAKNSMLKQSKELKDVNEANEALKKALTNQEAFSKTMSDQNNQLSEKIAEQEEEHSALKNVVKDLEDKLQEKLEDCNNLITQLNELKSTKEQAIDGKNQIIEHLEKDIDELKTRLENVEVEKSQALVELDNAVEESNAKAVKIEELVEDSQKMRKQLEEFEQTLNIVQETADKKVKELTSTIEEKDRDLVSKVETVNSLMSEVKNMTDMRTKLENNLQKIKKQMEREKENAVEREKNLLKSVENLEGAVRDKDNEISKQLSIILELRNEKDHLNEKIASMQGTIDNIQKELTGPVAGFDNRIPAEQDDNAVMLTPARKTSTKPCPVSPVFIPQKCQEFPKSQHKSEFAVPRTQPKQVDSALFNFLSDSSMESDTLDAGEVNRRFAALSRGERVAPIPLSSLKRRGGVPAGQGGLRFKSVVENEDISLSQIKHDLKLKERSFFKNKRQENKGKKAKQP